MARRSHFACALILMAAGGCASVNEGKAPIAQCDGSPQANRALVHDFYRAAILQKDPRSAFARYAAPDFVEHKPDVPAGNREATAEFLAGLVQSMPQAKWTVERTVAEGDLVVLHVRFTPSPGAPDYAIADFFRLRDCLIVEHWDVVAPPAKGAVNPNPAF